MDSSMKAMKWFFSLTCGKVSPGLVLILHSFGRDLGFKPHVHGIITKGGFNRNNKFIEWKKYASYRRLGREWMRIICSNLKKHFPKTEAYKNLFNFLWEKYGRNGFIIRICPQTLYNKKQLAKYIVRYVRHPAIANTRIDSFDSKTIAFHYTCQKTKKRINRTMDIEDFMITLLQHIPDRQFKMIRYYGAYARTKKNFCLRKSIKKNTTANPKLICPGCGKELKKLFFIREKPPPVKQILLVK